MVGEHNRYLMVVPVPAHRIDEGHFAVEGAFAEHLRTFRDKLGDIAHEIVVAGPGMTPEAYERDRAQLTVVDEAAERIAFRAMFPLGTSRVSYALSLPRILRSLYKEIQDATVVHASPSALYRPFEFPALLIARAAGKTTVSVTDIDRRNNARMNLESGHWDTRQYLVTRWLHEPFENLQHSICARACSLVLLKGSQLAEDVGHGRPNVKPFLDAAFSASQIIDERRLRAKLDRVANPRNPVELTYFGRLVDYKGVDHMLRAIAFAKSAGLEDFHFNIIGAGDAEPSLRKLVEDKRLGADVTFHGALPFGEQLFDRLYDHDVLLAAPLHEDTPRSALDGMASGQALLAYDTYYYRELADAGAPVHLVRWRDDLALGLRLFELCRDRERLVRDMRAATVFAAGNTQEVWLDRRARWTQEVCAH